MQIYYTYVHENLRKTQASALRILWFLPQSTHVAPAMPITTSTHQRIGFGSTNLALFLQQALKSCRLILLFHHFPTYSCGSTSGVFNCKGQFLALFHITLQPQWASNLWFSQKLAATSCLQEDWKFGYPPDYIHPESKCFSVLELNFFFRIEPNPETQGTADDLELHCLLRFSSQTNQEDWECQRWGEENWQKIPPLCSLNTRDSFDSFAWMDYLTQRYSWWFRAPSSSPNWTGNQLKDMPKIELATLISYTWSNNWHPSSKLNGKKNSNTLPPWPMEFNCYCSCKIFGH